MGRLFSCPRPWVCVWACLCLVSERGRAYVCGHPCVLWSTPRTLTHVLMCNKRRLGRRRRSAQPLIGRASLPPPTHPHPLHRDKANTQTQRMGTKSPETHAAMPAPQGATAWASLASELLQLSLSGPRGDANCAKSEVSAHMRVCVPLPLPPSPSPPPQTQSIDQATTANRSDAFAI